ncbi:MAG TPA: rhamnulokinase family protein [Pyrinomonadaceae bacterium]|jgi:rhamnulokinase
MVNELYIAVDLGAGSGRVFLCDLGAKFSLEEIHRFAYPPQPENGFLRWDFAKIFDEIKTGLKNAARRAKQINRKIYSLGVDSWAVDYGLLDRQGNLLANPVCYRDPRTAGAMEKVFERLPHRAIFEKTGIQFLNFNTIFQLASEDGVLNRASKLLLLPDLINYFLTGKIRAEYTNATTTQLLNARTKNWDFELLEKLDLPASLLPEIIPAGTDLGFLKGEIAAELDLENVRVVAPATHDTASAVAGAPLAEHWAYISSGTWSLVGVELGEPLIDEQVARFNFTNEGGAFGTIRFLKNVMGLWIFESCRREWKSRGVDVGYETLLRETSAIKNFKGFIFPDDERFLNPPEMLGAIAEQMRESGLYFDENPAAVCKIIFDSLAFRYASLLDAIRDLTGAKLAGVQLVGGGGRNDYLNQMTANASGLTVQSGLTEATVAGNALVQAIAAGRFKDLDEARGFVRGNVSLKAFAPQELVDLSALRHIYRDVEAKYIK